MDPVVIAGGGPVGLALALGLARRKVSSIVLEKDPALSVHSKAGVVLTRTLEVLEQWDLLDAFKEAGNFVTDLTIRNIDDRILLQVDFSLLAGKTTAPGVLLLPQNETERLLYESCISTGLVDVRLGHWVESFVDQSERVEIRAVGPSGPYTLTTPFLCGCDGAHSTVRQGLGFGLLGKTYNCHAILADIEIPNDRQPLGQVRLDLGSRGLNAAIQFATGLWRLIVVQPGPPASDTPDDAFVKEKSEQLLGQQGKIVWASSFKIHCRNSESFRKGRVVLLGDAAHLNSPAGGMGMNAGIQDAHNLAWKLARCLDGEDVDRLLDSYDKERQDAVRRGVDVATDRLTTFGVSTPVPLRRAIFSLVRMLTRSHRFTRRFASSFGMLSLRYNPSKMIHSSGGMLSDADHRKDIWNGRIFEHGSTVVAVRPDGVVGYKGRDTGTAKTFI